jgi:hypothetical protein
VKILSTHSPFAGDQEASNRVLRGWINDLTYASVFGEMQNMAKTMSKHEGEWVSPAGSGTRVRTPGGPESTQNQLILQGQLLSLQDNFIRVPDETIAGNAPGFMTDDTIAVFTGGSRTVLVAVKKRGIDKHENLASDRVRTVSMREARS